MSRRRLKVAAACGSTLLAFALVEAVLRAAAPVADPYEHYKRRAMARTYVPQEIRPDAPPMTTEAEEGLPGVTGKGTFTTNNLGFRGPRLERPKPAGERRVFVVGASTVECTYLDDAVAVPAALERALGAKVSGVRVYGAARSGDKTWDHVAVMAHRIAHLEPDLVVLLAGVNDLFAMDAGLDYLQLVDERTQAKRSLGFFLRLAGTELQIGRRLHRLSPRSRQQVFEEVTVRSNYREKVLGRARLPVRDEPLAADTRGYRENLKTIAAIARGHGARVVFCTQPASWNGPDPEAPSWHWMNQRPFEVQYPEVRMDEGLARFHEATREVGQELGVPVLDLARILPRSLAVFYDDVHFNVTGAAAFGELVADLVAREGLLR